VAEVMFGEMGHTSLVEALELTALIARKAPRRRGRVATRWLERHLEAASTSPIEQVALAVGALAALGSAGHETAFAALLDMAERASRRRARRRRSVTSSATGDGPQGAASSARP
jgi:hypothetical protein